MALLVADELVLLALYPSDVGWRRGHAAVPDPPSWLGAGVAVALLAELALMGAIVIDSGRVVATNPQVSDDAELRETIAQIATHRKRRQADWWGLHLAAGKPEVRRLAHLHQRNLILDHQAVIRRPWWTTTTSTWFVPEDCSTVVHALDRLRAALRFADGDERTIALLAVVHACGLHRAYFKDLTRRERERQIRSLVRRHWAWRAARSCVAAASLSAAHGL